MTTSGRVIADFTGMEIALGIEVGEEGSGGGGSGSRRNRGGRSTLRGKSMGSTGGSSSGGGGSRGGNRLSKEGLSSPKVALRKGSTRKKVS